jgi:hypothetical protein
LSGSDLQPPPGLPEPLPDGERILWQRSPQWRPFTRRAFQFNKIALYFVLLVGWIVGSAFMDGGGLSAALRALSWSVPPSLGVLIVLGLLGWLYARTTIYTVTDKRIVVQSGLAFPASINLPYARICSADLSTHSDGTGDIELTLDGQRVLYSMLWPNVRLLRITRPRPVLRALGDPRSAAEALAQALSADQQSEAEPTDERTPERIDEQRAATA